MAAKTNKQLILEFESFIPYIQSLDSMEDADWEAPLEAGKWSLKDVLCHIMLWDKYFYVEALVKIKEGLPLTAAHMDFNAFNANAVLYARTVTRQEAIRLFVLYRTKIIEVAASLSDTALEQNHRDGDGKKFSICKYLRDFISHDKHHKKQIEKYAAAVAATKA
ncbi:DinB family protein [Paenibacillus sp. FSL H8-0332]